MSRYPNEATRRFDQQFTETTTERDARLRKSRERSRGENEALKSSNRVLMQMLAEKLGKWHPIETVPLREEVIFFKRFPDGRHWVGVDEMLEDGLHYSTDASPTHWMPLPKLPD